MNYVNLSANALFSGISSREIEEMLECLGAYEKSFLKNELIYHIGDCVTDLGLVLEGSVFVEHLDVWGNRSLMAQLGPGEIFAETYACIPGEKLMVNVLANSEARILFINIKKIIQTCSKRCAHHYKMIQNLLSVTAEKNLVLSRKILNTSAKTIRGRMLSYLSFQAFRCGQQDFTIPFNRQELADYLSVDRSALSNEISKMQKEGLIKVKRNHFTLMTNHDCYRV